MIKIYKRTIKDKKINKLKHIEKGAFIYCINPSQKEIRLIEKELKLDPSLIVDALDPYEVPRIEYEDNVVYAFLSFPKSDYKRIIGIPFLTAITHSNVIVICKQEMSFLDNLTELDDFITTQKTTFVNLIFKKLISSYHLFVNSINKEVHKVSLSPGKISNADIIQLVWFEESLNLMEGDLRPTREILKDLLSGKVLKLYEKDKDLIEDTILLTEQLVDIVRENVLKISNIRNAYSAIVSANLNNTMKLLTAITVVLTVPTIIASIYGMNVNLPFDENPYAFVLIIAGIIFSVILMIYFFIKNDWM